MKSKKRLKLGIQFKIVACFLAIAAASVLSVAVVSMSQASEKLRDNAALHFGEMAQEQVLLVQGIIEQGFKDVELLAALHKDIYSRTTVREWEEDLKEKKAIFNAYEDITLIDPSGDVVTSTDYNYRGGWRYKAVFQKALAGEVAVSNVYMIPDPLKTVITFAAPVRGEGGEVKGVIATQFNMELVWAITDNLRLGNTGFAFILDEYGRYIAHPNKSLIMEKPDVKILSQLGEGRRLVNYMDEEGRERLANFAWMSSEEGDAGGEGGRGHLLPKWRVMVTQEAGEVLLLVKDFRGQAVIFSVIIFMAVAFTGFWLATTLVKPIKKLTKGAEAIGLGDLQYRVEVKSKDEIGRLAKTFNEMAKAISEDIEERQRAAEALKRSEELYRLLVEISPDAIFLTDLEANVLVANQQAVSLFGFPSMDKIIGANFFDYVAEEDQERARRNYWEIPERGTLRNVEYRMFRWDGSDFPAEFSASLLCGINGEPQGFIVVVRDITKRKRDEEALRASEERYRAVFDSTGTAMCLIGEDSTIEMANQQMAALLGHFLVDIQGKVRLVNLVYPDDEENFQQALRRLCEEIPPTTLQFPLRLAGKEGKILHALGNMARIPGTRELVVSLIDVTREWEYERALEEQAQQLKNFLSIASHELRHPITLIQGYVELLWEELNRSSSERVRENLKRVKSSALRLNLLGEELMDASRIEEGRYFLKLQSVRLDRLIDRALEEMRRREVGNPFSFRRINECRPIQVDREKVNRLLIILLENAAKFSPPGETVEVELEELASEQVVSILDRGIGVPDEEREKIFDRFYQVDDVMHHSIGLGMGLYIATEIVDAHGGRIWCDSREGGGSAFRFSLPL